MSDSSEAIHLVFAVDRAFLPYTAVAIESVLEHSHEPIHIHLLHDGGLGRQLRSLEKLIATRRSRFSQYQVDLARLAHLPVTDHVSLATYYRLSIAQLLPDDIRRVIYLDGDLIVRECLGPLYRWPTGRTGVAAVPESNPSSARLGLAPETPYFNAGVLVLDLEHWRRTGVTEELFRIADNCRDRLVFWDQDVLALHLRGRFSQLPPQWNVTHRYFFGQQRLELPVRPPAIVHFSGAGLKPWNKGVSHPYASEFWQTADRVAAFGIRIKPPGSVARRFKQRLANRLSLRAAAPARPGSSAA